MDGKELTDKKVEESSHYWLKRPVRVFPCLHFRGIQLCGRVLSTKARCAKGNDRLVIDNTCHGACGERGTLNHIVQV